MKATEEKKQMKTLSECINSLAKEGFAENFMVKKNGLNGLNGNKTYHPEEVKIVSFYRFEGESDPSDNSVLYAIEATDGVKGLLSDAYGGYADPLVSKFIEQVQEISKRERGSGKKGDSEPGQENGSDRQSDSDNWKFE